MNLADRERRGGGKLEVITGIGWYRREQWERLRELSADVERLEDTYDEWLSGAERLLKDLRSRGVAAARVDVDVEELSRWCAEQRRRVDSAARANFVAVKLRERDPRNPS